MCRRAEKSAPIWGELRKGAILPRYSKSWCQGEILVRKNEWTSDIPFENARGDVTEKKLKQKRRASWRRGQRPDRTQTSIARELQ